MGRTHPRHPQHPHSGRKVMEKPPFLRPRTARMPLRMPRMTPTSSATRIWAQIAKIVQKMWVWTWVVRMMRMMRMPPAITLTAAMKRSSENECRRRDPQRRATGRGRAPRRGCVAGRIQCQPDRAGHQGSDPREQAANHLRAAGGWHCLQGHDHRASTGAAISEGLRGSPAQASGPGPGRALAAMRRRRQALPGGMGSQAEALGWTTADLFGLHTPPERPHPSYRRLSRYDCTGLIWLLESRPVVALTDRTAAIENPTGSITVYRKHNKPALGPVGDSLDDLK